MGLGQSKPLGCACGSSLFSGDAGVPRTRKALPNGARFISTFKIGHSKPLSKSCT
ncbi:unnamed protein product [Chondrus crispus]|uniref:Uncharacterized protein n=1 Tax=Chondrus crispus TaxID=2769 RepID=R7QJF8_CHOCR|nr:unnamed protein product [Chondrus crispus]CDF37596.1 unnamed protein product [Chondrus crispus]|eukprot:XP_005717467.1 unnamed protein product [Chondrus crispus]